MQMIRSMRALALLAAFAAAGAGARGAEFDQQSAVRLTGRGADGWFIAVVHDRKQAQFAIRLRAGRRDSVWVATHPVRRGDTIGPADATRRLTTVWDLEGAEPVSGLSAA